MRKRHAARPVLEPMEDRLVLSVAGGATHAAADHAARVAALAARHATADKAASEVAMDHHRAARITQAAHHSHLKTKAKSSSLKSTISNLLLKSIFPF